MRKSYFIVCFFLLLQIAFSQDTIGPRIHLMSRARVMCAGTDSVFAFMDNADNTGMHMTKGNASMMGSKLNIQWLTAHHTGPGSSYRWQGKVMGIKMDFSVVVTRWVNGKEKVWETFGKPKMIILDWYRMFLVLTPQENGTTLAKLGIYYSKPKGSFPGWLLARRYARWCVKSMLRDTQKHFAEK